MAVQEEEAEEEGGNLDHPAVWQQKVDEQEPAAGQCPPI
jgi:hypothetical protein